jgi:hypothetical protein
VEITINYRLLKMIHNRRNTTIIIQNQGFVSRFLIGSYPILPKAFVSIFSNQEYALIKKDLKFSAVKKFFTASIFYRFYRLFDIL